MELTNQGSLVSGLVVTVVLVGLHLLAARIRELPGVPDTALGSFGGGLAVAYVFLHLLPELAEGNEGVAEALEDAVEVTPLLDLGIFVVALGGFWVSTSSDGSPSAGPPRIVRGRARRRASVCTWPASPSTTP